MYEDHNQDINERLIDFQFDNRSNDQLDLSKSGSDELVREQSVEFN